MAWQAQERFPDAALAPISTGRVHIIVSRLEVPSKWVTAICGNSGFHGETYADTDPVCMICVAAFARRKGQPDA
jgi:hypothetical protein